METDILSVREIGLDDVLLIIRYWMKTEPNFLEGMGVDLNKMPKEYEWREMLMEQINTPIEQKKSYCIIWLVGGVPSGHCNINKIVPGEEAYMHLHLWNTENRIKGMGRKLVALSLTYFFETYKLKRLYSEPYALNHAPNKTLPKVGFEFVHQIVTTPGLLNFEQPVNVWVMTREKYLALQHPTR